MIDLRSDTVTRPSDEMRNSILIHRSHPCTPDGCKVHGSPARTVGIRKKIAT